TEMLTAPGEHNAKRARSHFSVGKEQFVEISHPVKEQIVRICCFDLDVLLHHRSDAARFAIHGREGSCVTFRRVDGLRKCHGAKLAECFPSSTRGRPTPTCHSGFYPGSPRLPLRKYGRKKPSRDAQLLNFAPVIASRLLCQIFSLSAFDKSMPSRIRSVSRVYIVPFSGSNGQSDAKTILSRSKNAKPA